MKAIKDIFVTVILCLFTISCSGGLEGFKLKKRSTSGDEFLIQKKDPLVLPPDFSKLPSPDTETNNSNDEETQIEKVFKDNNLSNIEENEPSKNSDISLEKSILKKIQKQ